MKRIIRAVGAIVLSLGTIAQNTTERRVPVIFDDDLFLELSSLEAVSGPCGSPAIDSSFFRYEYLGSPFTGLAFSFPDSALGFDVHEFHYTIFQGLLMKYEILDSLGGVFCETLYTYDESRCNIIQTMTLGYSDEGQVCFVSLEQGEQDLLEVQLDDKGFLKSYGSPDFEGWSYRLSSNGEYFQSHQFQNQSNDEAYEEFYFEDGTILRRNIWNGPKECYYEIKRN